jgi:hypothetical protein
MSKKTVRKNPMLETLEGRQKYYLYQKQYRDKNIYYARVRFNPTIEPNIVNALKSLNSVDKNEWLKDAIVRKLEKENKIK